MRTVTATSRTRNVQRLALTCLAALLPLTAGAEIRRCHGEGNEIIFTDQPCENLGARLGEPVQGLDDDATDPRRQRWPLPDAPDPTTMPTDPADPRVWQEFRPEAYQWGGRGCRVATADDGLSESCLETWRWTVFDHPNEARKTSGWLVDQGGRDSVLVMVLDGASPIAIECPLTPARKVDPVGSRALAQRALAARSTGEWEAPGEECVANAVDQGTTEPALDTPLSDWRDG